MRNVSLAKRINVALENADVITDIDLEPTDSDVAAAVEKTVALEAFGNALAAAEHSPEIASLMNISQEGFLSKKIDAAKESLAQLTVGFRKWKAGGWDKLSAEDQLRGIKKAKLEFFYYNTKFIKNLENIHRLNREAFDVLVAGKSESDLEAHVKKLIPEIKAIIKGATGQESKSTDLKSLQKEFDVSLKAYKAPEGAKGDDKAVPTILAIVEKYKFTAGELDSLRTLSKTVSTEGLTKEEAESRATLISWLLFLTGLWLFWIIWIFGVRSAYVKEATKD